MMTQYLAHLIMYPYLVIGGYSTDVNDINECHHYIDTCLQVREEQPKPDPRLVCYGIALREYARHHGDYDMPEGSSEKYVSSKTSGNPADTKNGRQAAAEAKMAQCHKGGK